MNCDAKETLFELLYTGLVDIRAASGGGAPMSEADRDFVNSISNLLHNLPHALYAAESEYDYDRLLQGITKTARVSEREWLGRHAGRLSLDI